MDIGTDSSGGHKHTFLELFTRSKLDIPELNKLTGIPHSTLRLMLIDEPMPRAVVYKALAAISEELHIDLTIENCTIPLIPTFAQTLETLGIIPSDLAKKAEVNPDVIGSMLSGLPVFQEIAEQVLSALSAMTRQKDGFYTLGNVDVNILMIGVEISDVARLKAQIEQEYYAAKQGLSGLAQGTAKHQTITHKMEQYTQDFQTLEAMIGEQEAMNFLSQLEN